MFDESSPLVNFENIFIHFNRVNVSFSREMSSSVRANRPNSVVETEKTSDELKGLREELSQLKSNHNAYGKNRNEKVNNLENKIRSLEEKVNKKEKEREKYFNSLQQRISKLEQSSVQWAYDKKTGAKYAAFGGDKISPQPQPVRENGIYRTAPVVASFNGAVVLSDPGYADDKEKEYYYIVIDPNSNQLKIRAPQK